MMAKLLALAALAPLIGAASAITIPASEDSTVAKGKVTVSAGRAATLGVDFEDSALLKFDLPPGLKVSHVLRARLRLYVRSTIRAGNLQVKEALSTWSEDVASEALPLSEGTVALPGMLPVSKSKQFVFFDVTDLIKSWIGRESEIFGMAVASCGDSKFSISSKEGSASGYPAELEIDINPALPLFVGGDPETQLWDGAKIAEGTVATPQLADGSVSRAKIAQGAVGTVEIAPASITSAQLGADSVGPSQLAPGSVSQSELTNGCINTLNISTGAVTSEKLNLRYATFREERPSDEHGGDALIDGWQQRVLNTEENESQGSITLSENEITLQPGVYWIRAQCPASGVDEHQAALCDVTGEERKIVVLGTSEFSGSRTGGADTTHSFVEGFVKVQESAKRFQLLQYTYRSPSALEMGNYGLGRMNKHKANSQDAEGINNSLPSVYSTITILKIK